MKRFFLFIGIIIVPVFFMSCGGNHVLPGGSGLVEATEVIVSAQVGGQVEKMFVDEGDDITTGADIALIDTVTIALQLDKIKALRLTAITGRDAAAVQLSQAKLNTELSEKEYNRSKNLLAKGSTNQQSFDQIENGFQQSKLAVKSSEIALRRAEAELERLEVEKALLEKQLSDCHPEAPCTGTVVTKYIEEGELAAPGKPLVKIAQLDSVWVKIYLPPGELAGIKLGDRADVDPEDGRTTPLTGHITWISPEAEFTPKNVQTREARADLLYAVKITIANEDSTLKIGMPVSVTLPGN